MNSDEILGRIGQGRVIAVLRGDFGSRLAEIAAAILDGGIVALEMTLTSSKPLEAIAQLSRQFGARATIGAGTVLTTRDVDAAADAGAQFIVSPNMNPAVISRTKQRGLVSMPGCFTPTEILCALEQGADAAKLFPANSLGPDFVRAIRAPIPGLRVVPTGGITPALAKAYLAAGAWAVGVGSELVPKNPPAENAAIEKRAREYVESARP